MTCVVAAEHRRNAVQIPAHQEIRPPVAIEVPHQRGADRRELSLGGKGPQGEGPVPVVQGHGAREHAGSVALKHGESTRRNYSHASSSYALLFLKEKCWLARGPR